MRPELGLLGVEQVWRVGGGEHESNLTVARADEFDIPVPSQARQSSRLF